MPETSNLGDFHYGWIVGDPIHHPLPIPNWLRWRWHNAHVELAFVNCIWVDRGNIDIVVCIHHLLIWGRRRSVRGLVEKVVRHYAFALASIKQIPKPLVLQFWMINHRANLWLSRIDPGQPHPP